MFVYSLPILFNQIRLASPLEALFILLATGLVLYLTLPPLEKVRRPVTGPYLFSAWSGVMDLQLVFWPFFLILNGGLYSLDRLARSAYITVSSWDDGHFILLFPIFWWVVGVWRCSVHTSSKLSAALARLLTISVALEYALKLYIRIDFPSIFFNCENVMLDYGRCF